MLERESLKVLEEALSILEQGFSEMVEAFGDASMVMPGGMTIRPNGQARTALPCAARSEQEAKTGSWPSGQPESHSRGFHK